MLWTLAQDAPAEAAELPTKLDEVGKNLQSAATGDMDAIRTLLFEYGMNVVWAIVIIILTIIVAKIISGMVRKASGRAKLDLTLSGFFAKMVYYLILVLGATLAMSIFGANITSLAAVLAAAGFAVGMAMAGTLSNFAAGAMLLIFRPFKVGDVISAAGITAKVNEIELFTTSFDTVDNRRIIVPNSQIYGGTIENISHHGERRVDVAVGIDYSADIDKTRQVLSSAADSLASLRIDGEGRGHAIVLGDLGDSSVNWTVRFWTKSAEYWNVKEQLTRAVKMHLDEAGIGIPFPQMDVHLDKSE